MKIGLVCPYNMARGGAVKEIVIDMRAGLKARGHEVKIITGRPQALNDLDAEDTLFVGHVTDFRSPTHTLASFAVSNESGEVERLIAAENFDVLHFHEPGLPILSRQILEQSNSVNIATFHAKLPDTLMSQTIGKVVTPYLRSIFKDLDELVVGSHAAADYVRTLTRKEVHYIPNGVNLEQYKYTKRAIPGSPKKLLYIGRLEYRKGVKYLLQAYHLLSQELEDVSLILAGDGPDRRKLELLAETLALPNVTFMGYVDHALKLRLLSEADLFCAPSIFGESFGLVLIEAMATGLVTVAGDNPGYAAVMQELGSVSVVNPHDAREFARRLQLLLCEESLRILWRDWAREYVKQFDYDQIINQYEALYVRALREHGKPVLLPKA